MVLGELDSNMQKDETRPLSYTIHKNKLKMDEGPERETGIHQNPREESRKKLSDLSRSNFLFDTSPKARELKAKMNDWDLTKIKTSALQRKQSTTLKGNQCNGKRYLQLAYQTKGCYPKSMKNSPNSTPVKQIIQWRNWQKTWIDISLKKTSRWPTDTWKDAQCRSSSGK